MRGKELVSRTTILLYLVLCACAYGQVSLHVPGDYATIQDAIDVAMDGDVVEIAPGRYTGSGNRDIDFKGKAITVRGSTGPVKTVIVCQDNNATFVQGHRGFYFHSQETEKSVLQDVTIQQGLIPNHQDLSSTLPASGAMGGGIYCVNSSPTLINIHVLRCRAQVGGGIGCVAGNPTLLNCVIEECSAGGQDNALTNGMGGGVALTENAHLQMKHCIVRNNTIDSNGMGSGLFIRNSSALIQFSDISGNTASGRLTGGGLYVASATLSQSTDAEPTTGLYRRGVVLRHCLMTGNAAHRGAAIFVQGRPVTDNATLVRDAVNAVPQLSLNNVTVAANRLHGRDQTYVDDPPGAIVEVWGQSVEIRNSILWHNGGDSLWLEPASRAWVSFSNIEGGFPGSGNIHRDPLFADMAGADFHLKSRAGRFDDLNHQWVTDLEHSPCIDRGHPDDAVVREPEPHGQRINMGAYGGTIQASKGLERTVWHVDGTAGSETPGATPLDGVFLHIQAAVDAARDGDTVLIWPGTYVEREGIVIRGKAITIQGALGAPLIKTPEDYAFSFYQGEGHDSVLSNLIITGSRGAVYCQSASPTLQHLTIVNNDFGVLSEGGSDPVILNSIFWSNQNGDLYCDGRVQCRVDYSCIEHIEQSMGLGNISLDPLFVDPVHDDFHLRSQQGHYWPEDDQWIQDSTTSPCIDAGHPTLSPVHEPGPNGGRLNMGAYGGTDQASLSSRPVVKDSVDRAVDQSTEVTIHKQTGSAEDRP